MTDKREDKIAAAADVVMQIGSWMTPISILGGLVVAVGVVAAGVWLGLYLFKQTLVSELKHNIQQEISHVLPTETTEPTTPMTTWQPSTP